GCDRGVKARGWCKNHWQRWKRTGSAGSAEFPRSRKVIHKQLKDNIRYGSAHDRVRRWLGSPSDRQCVCCGSDAKDWAYVGGCPDEMSDEKGRPYSPSPLFYEAMCRSCHRKYDYGKERWEAVNGKL